MKIDPRTKLLILAITSISVFLNGSITIECIFAALPFLLLLSTKKIYTSLKYAALFLALLAIQLWLVPLLPVSAGGIIYMFAVYIRKLIPCFMLGSLLISTTRVSEFLAAVGKLRLPKGFTISLSITLRYFPTMGEEWNSIKDAMALRGIPETAAGSMSGLSGNSLPQPQGFSAILCGRWSMFMSPCWYLLLKYRMKLHRQPLQEALIMYKDVPAWRPFVFM